MSPTPKRRAPAKAVRKSPGKPAKPAKSMPPPRSAKPSPGALTKPSSATPSRAKPGQGAGTPKEFAPARAAQSAISGPELLARCERAVEMALARGAQQAECYWEAGASLGVELQNGRIASTSTDTGQGGSVRVIAGRRLGFAYCTLEEDLAATIDRALANARHGEAGYSLPSAGRAKPLQRWDDRIAALDAGSALDLARGLLAGAKEAAPEATFAGGGAGLDFDQWAVASSEGAASWDRQTVVAASASLVLADGERSVSAGESRSSHRLDLDARDVGAEAGRTTMSLRRPAKVAKGGKFPILLRPEAALDLIVGPAVGAAMGDEAKRGKSFWSESLGNAVASPTLTIADDPLHPKAIGGSAFDGEGLSAQRLPIVQAGVLRTFLFDSWDAHRHKEESTHSAVREGFKSRPTAGVHHLVCEGKAAKAWDRLVGGVDDGFVVESVLGAHTANATTGDFSVTAPNVWRIRKGAVEGPVSEIALSGRLPEVLRRVSGVCDPPKALDGARVPALLLDGLDVSV